MEQKKSIAEKISSTLKKIKSSYTIGVHKHPFAFTILGVFAINLVVLVVSAFIANSVDDTYNGVVDAFARGSIKWLITPNSILNIDNPKTMFLASVVVVLSMVLFSGVVIAMTTNSLKEYFSKKSNAEGKLFLQDHIIIFNWNSKVPQMVEDLVYAGENTTVLIYSAKDKDFIKSQINNVLNAGKNQNIFKVNVIVKSGNPILKSGLQDISIENAKSIIIMAREDLQSDNNGEISNCDLFTIKTLINVGGMRLNSECAIIVEVAETETVQIIKDMACNVSTLTDNRILPVAFNQRLGLFISQFILNPGLEKVFVELFSFLGAEIYPVKKMSIENALLTLDKAIPLMESESHLYVLSENKPDALSTAQFNFADREIKIKRIDNKDQFTVILIGINSKYRYILDALNKYKDNIFANMEVLSYEKIDEDFLNLIGNSDKKTIIMILSDESAGIESYDSNVYHAVIKLQQYLVKKPNLQVIVELLDPVNHNIIADFNVDNTIVSNRLVGLLIAQLALNKENYDFYENLMTFKPGDKEDFEIKIDYVYDLLDKEDLSFASRGELVSAFYYSSGKRILPLGMVKEGKIEYFCSLPVAQPINFAYNDKLIYIQY